ncbi:MAG: hypothetical protein WCS30_04070, partial [Selenomonadaceae bacterium]
YSQSRQTGENPAEIKRLGEALKKTGSQFYTCHCTGQGPYEQLKDSMSSQIEYVRAGRQMIL